MTTTTTYHAGGFIPAAPAQNKAEQWDSTAGTYTAWNPAGAQTSQRALTTAETAALAAQDATATQITNGATLRAKAIAALDANTTYLATAPTATPQDRQLVAVTRECSALIRLLVGQLDTTTGT